MVVEILYLVHGRLTLSADRIADRQRQIGFFFVIEG
jgi:hypothetical protein